MSAAEGRALPRIFLSTGAAGAELSRSLGSPHLLAVALALETLAAPRVARAAGEPRTHDNVFVHGGLSTGPSSMSYDAPMNSPVRHRGTSTALGLGLEFAAGGTLPGGLVLGGIFLALVQPTPSFDNPTTMEGWESATTSFGTLSPFVRYYPMPATGLHVDAFVGYALQRTTHTRPRDFLLGCPPIFPDCFDPDFTIIERTERSDGIALGGGAGYELWVANHWSVGLTARVLYAHTWSHAGTYSFWAPTLMIGVSLN